MEGEPAILEVEDALDESVLMATDGAVANRCRCSLNGQGGRVGLGRRHRGGEDSRRQEP